MQVQYKFTDKELKKLFNEHMIIIADTREQKNQHVLDYFNKKKINYEEMALNAGDYSIKLKAAPELGIVKDVYLPVMIEKKNSIDELAASIKDRTRFENEFIKAMSAGTKINVLVEDGNGYKNIIEHNYRSLYNPKAFLASLKAFEARYNFSTAFIDKKYTGNFIYYTLRYYLYEFLKG